MKVTYSPGENDVQVWDFDPNKVPQSQAELIERRYGAGPGQWEAWIEDVRQGGARARRILLWHLLRQTHHTLRYEDTPDFQMGQVTIDYSLSDLRILRQRLLDTPMDDAERAEHLAAVDAKIAEETGVPVDEQPADEPAVEPGKASNTSD